MTSVAHARSSLVFCSSTSADRSVVTAARLLTAREICKLAVAPDDAKTMPR